MRTGGNLAAVVCATLTASVALWTDRGEAAARPHDAAWEGAPTELAAIVPAGRATRSMRSCRRWKAFAAHLGETYAGHRLRRAVSSRLCALAEETPEDQVWSWPWRHHDVRADLPPLRHARYGVWEIRCGEAGRRRRCALAMEAMLAPSGETERGALRLVAHIVIDSVGGRESALWRVHVAQDDARRPVSDIALEVAGTSLLEPFDACGRRGCMAEADPKRSAEVASWLWSGRAITVTLADGGAGGPLSAVLSGNGFRAGWTELVRLRRHEGRALAGR